jgi:HSP20 family molecular chaperone IbpA
MTATFRRSTAPSGAVRIQRWPLFEKLRAFELIDQHKIAAELTDGVLSLTLPEVEKAKPRTIQVK